MNTGGLLDALLRVLDAHPGLVIAVSGGVDSMTLAHVAHAHSATQATMVRFCPKRATSQPVVGVAMAVARMLKVVVQAISSGVAAMLPCICGSRVEATSRVVA